ncbi:MAG: M1 family aminopeptidase [Chitinophagales bacterium]
MNFKVFAVLLLLTPILMQCDPSQRVYKSKPYKGDIDTSYIGYDNPQYEEEYDYDYDWTDSDYYAEDTISPYSPSIYRATKTRTHDLIHTQLEVRFDWAKAFLYGKATLTLKPYFYPSDELVLDAKGMDLHEIAMVTAGGKTPLKYTYDNLQIRIDLGKMYTKSETYTVFIDYTAKPNELPEGGSAAITSNKGLYFINNDGSNPNKPMQIWTQGETEASSCWFPTIDKPNERTTQELAITIEDKFTTLSNGIMVSSKKNADGTRTDTWKLDMPHAPYLFMMAIGEFAVVKDTWKGIPVDYYVEPEYASYAKGFFGNTPEMLTFFSDILNYKYPWPKYAQVVVRDYVSGAMENTSATLHGEFIQQNSRAVLDESYEDVVSHELFHQWFGDIVTCESWSNIPLNESFATYGEYLWREYKYGRAYADEHLLNDLNGYISESESKKVDLIRFNYEDKEDMFDSHSYAKGGTVLHMLRKYVGDEAFFTALNLYLKDNAFQSVEIHNLRLAFEEVTGEDLNWFFNQWFLGAGHPVLNVRYGYDEITATAMITVEQLQSKPAPIYVLPVDVDIYVNNTPERHRIIIDRPVQTFYLPAEKKPAYINFDAENMLTAEITFNLSDEEQIAQYNLSPLFLDRYRAIEWLSSTQYYNADAMTTIVKALDDKSAVIRQFALDTITINEETAMELKEKVVKMAQSDKSPSVRASAVARIPQLGLNNTEALILNALKDSSYNVAGTALQQLYILHPDMALNEARKLQSEKSINILFAVWQIIAAEGDAKDSKVFETATTLFSGWERYYIMIYYSEFLKRMSDFEVIKKGADFFAGISADNYSGWLSFFSSSYLSGISEHYRTNMESADPVTQSVWTAAVEYIDAKLAEIQNSYDY